jgi:hypothetical protein
VKYQLKHWMCVQANVPPAEPCNLQACLVHVPTTPKNDCCVFACDDDYKA